MRCIDEGQLRAYLDRELAVAEQGQIASHLAACAACARQLAQLRETAASVSALLDPAGTTWTSETDAATERAGASAALAVFWSRYGDGQGLRQQERDALRSRDLGQAADSRANSLKERVTQMIARMLAPATRWRVRRPVFATLAILAVCAMALALGPVQSLAQDLFKTFRVQQFSAVTVRVPGMNELPQPREISDAEKAQLVQMLSALGTPNTNATATSMREVATQDEARAHFAQHGGTLRVPGQLPAGFAGQPARYGVGDPTSSQYTLNVQVAKQYLALANQPELPWPPVDQLTFGLGVPAAVVMAYGGQTKGFGIVQLASPILAVPKELDVNAFRAAVLALPGLPEDTLAQVRAVQNWEKTLIVPVPQDAITKNVSVDRAPGLLILDGQGRGSLLMWQADDVVYAIGGHLTEDEVRALAESMMG